MLIIIMSPLMIQIKLFLSSIVKTWDGKLILANCKDIIQNTELTAIKDLT
jgi:hypothetical protein